MTADNAGVARFADHLAPRAQDAADHRFLDDDVLTGGQPGVGRVLDEDVELGLDLGVGHRAVEEEDAPQFRLQPAVLGGAVGDDVAAGFDLGADDVALQDEVARHDPGQRQVAHGMFRLRGGKLLQIVVHLVSRERVGRATVGRSKPVILIAAKVSGARKKARSFAALRMTTLRVTKMGRNRPLEPYLMPVEPPTAAGYNGARWGTPGPQEGKGTTMPKICPRGIAPIVALVVMAAAALGAVRASAEPWVVYEGGDGPAKGKQVVLVSGDEEYRSEEALAQLGKILAVRHGFRATVLFAVDPATGVIDPVNRMNIPGLETLQSADLMILATRFRDLPR